MKLVWIITFGLASLLASPISAQTPTPDSAAAQKSRQLTPANVRAPSAATLTAPANGAKGAIRGVALVPQKGDIPSSSFAVGCSDAIGGTDSTTALSLRLNSRLNESPHSD